MRSASILRESRRRAGLTQAELAVRAGTTQSVIARYESGRVRPSLETLYELILACGLDLQLHVAHRDPVGEREVQESLDLTPEQRLDRLVAAVRFIDAGRSAMAAAHG